MNEKLKKKKSLYKKKNSKKPILGKSFLFINEKKKICITITTTTCVYQVKIQYWSKNFSKKFDSMRATVNDRFCYCFCFFIFFLGNSILHNRC